MRNALPTAVSRAAVPCTCYCCAAVAGQLFPACQKRTGGYKKNTAVQKPPQKPDLKLKGRRVMQRHAKTRSTCKGLNSRECRGKQICFVIRMLCIAPDRQLRSSISAGQRQTAANLAKHLFCEPKQKLKPRMSLPYGC